jgi:hypothetical protein
MMGGTSVGGAKGAGEARAPQGQLAATTTSLEAAARLAVFEPLGRDQTSGVTRLPLDSGLERHRHIRNASPTAKSDRTPPKARPTGAGDRLHGPKTAARPPRERARMPAPEGGTLKFAFLVLALSLFRS